MVIHPFPAAFGYLERFLVLCSSHHKIMEKKYNRSCFARWAYLKWRFTLCFVFFLCQNTLYTQVLTELPQHVETTKGLINKGFDEMKAGDFAGATRYFTGALQQSEREGDTLSITTCMYVLGEINYKMGYPEKALKFLKQAENISSIAGNTGDLCKIKNGLGNILVDQNKTEEALTNFNWVLATALTIRDSALFIKTHLNIGLVYAASDDFSQAKTFFTQALRLSNPLKDSLTRALAYINLADCYRHQGQTDSAIYCLKKADNLSTVLSPYEQQVLNGGLALSYEQKGEFKKAFYSLKKHFEIIMNLYNEQSDKAVNELQEKYQSEKKEKKILQLTLQKYRDDLSISAQKEALNRRNTLLILFSAFILISLIIAFFLLRQYRSETVTNRLLVIRNEEITHQKKLIEENLRYTERLQTALKHDLNYYMQCALRKQMNPHFLFNSLNSIQCYVLQHDRTLVNEYLADFARLMRMVLNHSAKELITLKDELESLKLYIALEQRRFEKKFMYSIEVESGLTTSLYLIPPFMLQPYVENAIWHGLLHKAEEGFLQVKFKREGEFICCVIQDNGVGRTAAEKARSRSSLHESMATKIVEKRVEAYNYLGSKPMSVQIQDLFDEQNIATGTLVRVCIPLISVIKYNGNNSKVA